LRPDQENSLRDPISKIIRAKWTGGMAQAVECLLWKYKPQSHQKEQKGKSSIKKRESGVCELLVKE
jgi:hypothetical protein